MNPSVVAALRFLFSFLYVDIKAIWGGQNLSEGEGESEIAQSLTDCLTRSLYFSFYEIMWRREIISRMIDLIEQSGLVNLIIALMGENCVQMKQLRQTVLTIDEYLKLGRWWQCGSSAWFVRRLWSCGQGELKNNKKRKTIRKMESYEISVCTCANDYFT